MANNGALTIIILGMNWGTGGTPTNCSKYPLQGGGGEGNMALPRALEAE